MKEARLWPTSFGQKSISCRLAICYCR